MNYIYRSLRLSRLCAGMLYTSLFFLSLLHGQKTYAQCYNIASSYCTSITATNIGAYGMGIQNVSLGYTATNFLVNNTTAAGTGTPIYFDYTNMVDTTNAGSTLYWSIKGGSSNQTTFRIYVDWNLD